MAGSKTRKVSKKGQVLTIPELRRSMQHIVSVSHSIMKNGKRTNMKHAVMQLQREWQNVFHKPLSEKLAREYLMHISHKRLTRRRGGGPIMYAPVGYRLEPGADLPYGKNSDYVSSGFFTPLLNSAASCGKIDVGSRVPESIGSNLVGGRRRKTRSKRGGGDISAISFRPFAAQNPPTYQHDLMMQMKGQPPSPGGEAYNSTYSYRMGNPNYTAPIPAAPSVTYDICGNIFLPTSVI